MSTVDARTFAFPARSRLDELEHEAAKARNAQLVAALANAVATGHEEGLARGREEAKAEARALLERSCREGSERGHAAGLAEMKGAAQALCDALRAFEDERAKVVAEAEAFCVDLALAIVSRLVETDKVRAEFIHRSTQTAMKALAPHAPTAVFLNPIDQKCAAATMSDLPLLEDATLLPGTARVEAGRLLVESSIDEAFAQIRSAIVELKTKRGAKKSSAPSEARDAV